MGKGNCCVFGKCEGLYYIDTDDFEVFRRNDPHAEELETRLKRDLNYSDLTSDEWIYDEEGTENEREDIIESFIDTFTELYPSFKRCEKDVWLRSGAYGNYERKAILESGLFYIALQDNDWSFAIELLQKEEPMGLNWMENLQSRLYELYLVAMKTCLLLRLPGIGTYGGAWTSGRITADELSAAIQRHRH